MKNILLTGQPRSGKSTLLEKIIGNVAPKKGFLTSEIKMGNDRLGFQLVTSTHQTISLAHIDFESSVKVGRYGLDLENLEQIIPTVFTINKNDFLYIDEIGQMQLYSDKFKDLVLSYLNSGNIFLGTISSVYSDDFIKQLLARSDIEVITVTPETRDDIYNMLFSRICSVS